MGKMRIGSRIKWRVLDSRPMTAARHARRKVLDAREAMQLSIARVAGGNLMNEDDLEFVTRYERRKLFRENPWVMQIATGMVLLGALGILQGEIDGQG
jgi:hypothetical protein